MKKDLLQIKPYTSIFISTGYPAIDKIKNKSYNLLYNKFIIDIILDVVNIIIFSYLLVIIRSDGKHIIYEYNVLYLYII